jgi:hypothetical protein
LALPAAFIREILVFNVIKEFCLLHLVRPRTSFKVKFLLRPKVPKMLQRKNQEMWSWDARKKEEVPKCPITFVK